MSQRNRSLIGCLSYLAARKLHGISFGLLEYVYATKNDQLDFTCMKQLDIRSYCDADYAANKDDRQSIGRFIVFVGRSLLSWKTAEQKCVTLSSKESSTLRRQARIYYGYTTLQ
ncbi:hypothetical protein TNIN_30041 [Trichonephila inaurata madagascariensis]|uniref:Mitochondrial protein n=1 Tax=Trichonephila inaurata madagascariensis TaxID=2747483 RepID=A0A8X7C1I7_9ARAC|nr:hypothetical protein TNIN_30041 [Trichonephila inaurata madagascariensis]